VRTGEGAAFGAKVFSVLAYADCLNPMSPSMIFVISTNRVKPGTADLVRAAAASCRLETLKEEGCLSYDLQQSTSDPHCFVFVERWETREHLAAHFQTSHLKAWRAAAADFVIERRVEIIHPDRVEIL
jgi:quinol monooxygenase YgiN